MLLPIGTLSIARRVGAEPSVRSLAYRLHRRVRPLEPVWRERDSDAWHFEGVESGAESSAISRCHLPLTRGQQGRERIGPSGNSLEPWITQRASVSDGNFGSLPILFDGQNKVAAR